MTWNLCRPVFFPAALLVLLVGLVACGDDSHLLRSQDDLAFFVGDWAAEVLVATSIEDPEVSRDLLADGAEFTMNVQPSGVYTARLTFAGRPFTEIGRLVLDGEQLTFFVDFPVPDTSVGTLRQLTPDRVLLLGETSVDVDYDLSADSANLRTELVRQEEPA